MIVSCKPCNRAWRYPCKPCRDGFVDYHETEFGHEVVVHEAEPTRMAAHAFAESIVPADFPDWFFPSRRKRNRDTA